MGVAAADKRLAACCANETLLEHRAFGLHRLLSAEQKPLAAADLIVAATGSWAAESALNRWHLDQGRTRPILYGWTEAHACAGHGVAIMEAGGCLQCQIGRTGAPSFKVLEWPDGGDANQEEPACGAHYQPYGPIELSYVTAMLSELSLDCMLQPPVYSSSRVFVTSEDRIANLGGHFGKSWMSAYGEGNAGARIIDRPWLRTQCAACGGT